ncbi:MAG: tetratricopeptide repeat protein [Phycisphaerae bacterium]|nr:tetratricopeptide repeat protein [Phycisphaerae bacterium]
MATRLNKKVIIIVSACSFIAVSVVGFVGLQQWRSDPTRFVIAGDEKFAQNDFEEAARLYGRAIGKQPNNLEFHTKFIEASRKIVPASMNSAREKYLQYVGSLLKRAQIARNDEKLWREVLAERLLQSELNDSAVGWQSLGDLVSQDMMRSIGEDDPLTPLAKTLEGYARSRAVAVLTPDEVTSTLRSLEETMPKLSGADRDLALGGILGIRAQQAISLAGAGQARQSAEAWQAFDDLVAKAKEEAAPGLQLLKWDLMRLRLRSSNGDTSVTPAMIGSAADALAALALATDEGVAVFEALKTIGGPDVPDGFTRAARMLEAYLAKHPDSLMHRRGLAYCLQFKEPDRAEAEAMRIIDAPMATVSLASASQDEMRVAAAQQLFDIEFTRLSKVIGKDAAAADASLKRLDAATGRIRELSVGLTDDSSILRAEGKLALAREEYRTADAKFAEIAKQGSTIDSELYVLWSAAKEGLKETGEAQRLVDKGLELAPENIELLERRGGLELFNGKFDAAVKTLTQVTARDPNRQSAARLLAAALRGRDGGTLNADDPRLLKLKNADELRTSGKLDEARAILEPMHKETPADVEVITLLAFVEAAAGNTDKAIALCKQGLTLSPGNAALQRTVVLLSSNDPVSRVVDAVTQQHSQEPDRTVWIAIRMQQVIDGAEGEVRRLTATRPEEARAQGAFLPQLRAAAAEWKDKAMQADPAHPAMLDFRFTTALVAKDFDTAKSILAQAEQSARDPTIAPLFKARLSIVQGEPGLAVDSLTRAIESGNDSADLFRLRGAAYEQGGDMAGAVASYAEAYRRKPIDMNAVKPYVRTLIQTGERNQALVVLRDARGVAGDDLDIGESWLDLEAEIGDRRKARLMREGRYAIVPSDRRNAMKTAVLLADLQPEHRDVTLDSPDKPKYTEQQWRSLAANIKERELELVRNAWRASSDRIFASLMAQEPQSIELAMLRSSTYRRQGKYTEAEKTLKDLIYAAGASATSQMWIALGVHYVELNKNKDAGEAFSFAVRMQDDATREADASLAEYWFQKTDWARAIVHLERVAERSTDRSLKLRMAEAYGRLGKFDLAKQKIAEAGNRDVVVYQLEASIAEGEGDRLKAEGKRAEAVKVWEDGLAALAKAQALAANNPVIPVQEASLYRKQYDAGDTTKLDPALAAADRATKLRGDYWPASMAKADLLLAKQNPAGAVQELERFVRAVPSNSEGRRHLIKTLLELQMWTRAVEIAREAVSLSPNDPQWRMSLAEVEFAMGNLDAAIVEYEQADKLRPDPLYLQRLTDFRLRKQPPDWSAVLSGLRSRPDVVAMSPYLQSAVGVALIHTGEMRGGLESMRSAFVYAKSVIAAKQSNPSLIDSWYGNLRLIYLVNRTADAEKFVYEITGGKPDLRDLRWLSEMWFGSGPDGQSRAVELAQQALTIDDGADPALTARMYDIIGSVKYTQGDCKGALESFAAAIKALPGESAILNNFAYLCGECADDPKRGLEPALTATRLAPQRAEYWDTLGYVQFKSGDLDTARTSIETSLRLAESASANVHMAEILIATERKDEAMTHIKRAGDLKPDATLQKRINTILEQLR